MRRNALQTAVGIGVATALALLGGTALAADGDLDRSFSGDGKQTTDFGGDEFAEDVAIQRNGKIVVLAQGAPSGFALIRYNPDGSLDPTFSANGIVTAGLGGSRIFDGAAVALQGGKIVVVGTSSTLRGDSKLAVARFTRDGARDRSFAGDGTRTISFGRRPALHSEGSAVAIDDQRRIVVAGWQETSIEGTSSFAAARLTRDGALDRSFSRDGRQLTGFHGIDFAYGAATTGDGGVVVVGYTIPFKGHGTDRSPSWAIARYRPDGRLDRSFSENGKRHDFKPLLSGDAGPAYDVAVAGGRIVAAGTTNGHFALARYRRDGTLDRSFSGDGHQTTSVHPEFGDIAHAVEIQADGRIVLAGRSLMTGRGGRTPRGTFALARYLDNGRLDRSFSGDGKRTLRFGASGPDAAWGMALQENGAILAAGVDTERRRGFRPGLFPRAERRSRHSEDIAVARFKG